MKKIIFSILTIMSMTVFAEKIRIGGGSGPMKNIFPKIKASFEKETGITLELHEDGPDRALVDLDAGKLDVASAGLSQDQWFQLLGDKKLPLKNSKSDFKFRTIGRDIIRVLINKDIAVKSLNKIQLAKIFSGKSQNWKEFGGPNIPIKVVIGKKIPGIYKFFAEKGLGGVTYTTKDTIESGDTDAVEKVVAKTKGAVGLGPVGDKDNDQVIYPAIPIIGRPIIAATKGIPSKSVLKLYDFLDKADKKYLQNKYK